MPAFVNLQQYHVEAMLHARLAELGGEVRFLNTVSQVTPRDDGARLTVDTPDGPYDLEADWLVSCEGVRSVVRQALGLAFEGQVFEDKFLIADVKMTRADFPAERWFWFEPPFHAGQTALLHRQADDVWRIDLQLGWDADVEAEKRPERVRPRIEAMLGHADFEFDWLSVYVFQCRTLERYVHGRILFAGDSAHQVSPFGARGGAGGVQDADNLGWKLARVLDGRAGPDLLESYQGERRRAALENILNSTRSTDFMTPKSAASRVLRDETLALAAEAPFARALVNSGRLSVPAHLTDSPLNTPDDTLWRTGRLAPGSPAADAPIRRDGQDGFLLEAIGDRFVLLAAGENLPHEIAAGAERVAVLALGRDLEDPTGLLASRYDLTPGAMVLFRPDQHLAMRRRVFDPGFAAEAVARSLAANQAAFA